MCSDIGEGVLWQKAIALQFPELSPSATSSLCRGHMQKGNLPFHLLLSLYLVCAYLLHIVFLELEGRLYLCFWGVVEKHTKMLKILHKDFFYFYFFIILSDSKKSFPGFVVFLTTLFLKIANSFVSPRGTLSVDSTWSRCAHWWMTSSLKGWRPCQKTLRRIWDPGCSGTSNSSPGGHPTM